MHQNSFVHRKSNSLFSGKFLLLIILLLSTLAVFISKNLELVLGPIIAVLICYLYFSGYAEEITALVIVANDAMGTILLGSLSFPYLLACLVILKLFSKRKFDKAELALFIIALLLEGELLIVGFIGIKNFIYLMTYVLAVIALPRTSESFVKFTRGISAAVLIISLHAMFTGGVEYVDYDELLAPFAEIAAVRKGVLGVGTGDPNFSSFIVNIGIICVFCDPYFKKWQKIVLSIPMFYAIALTASISGLLALLLIIAVMLLLGKNKLKSMVILLISLVLLVLFYQWYVSTNVFKIGILDSYVMRIDEKLMAFELGDMASLTTNRSRILEGHIEYFIEQPLVGFFIGGNSIIPTGGGVSHNTYVGFLLQVGLIGAVILLSYIIRSLYRAFTDTGTDEKVRKYRILFKILTLFMMANLSFYEGSTWALSLVFLILL